MGIFTGITGYVLLAVLALGILATVLVAVIAAAKLGKEEDEVSVNPLAEYDGVDGFKAEEKSADAPTKESVHIEAAKVQETQAPLNTVVSDAKAEKTETQPTPPPPQDASAAITAQAAPAAKAAPQPQLSQENPISAESVSLEQRQGDWSNYDGEYEGYYYDPIDVCYYEGNPPVYVQKMYLPPAPDPIIRKIKSPAAPLENKPKAKRAALAAPKQGTLDIAAIYGQYVIEHEGNEYFFTLYSNKGEVLFESFNYANEQFCRDAVKRFKKHVLAGAFSVEGETGKFRFVLVRKLNTYYGPEKETRTDAEGSISTLKYFAQTDVVRAQ
jgi:hypothetical protein